MSEIERINCLIDRINRGLEKPHQRHMRWPQIIEVVGTVSIASRGEWDPWLKETHIVCMADNLTYMLEITRHALYQFEQPIHMNRTVV